MFSAPQRSEEETYGWVLPVGVLGPPDSRSTPSPTPRGWSLFAIKPQPLASSTLGHELCFSKSASTLFFPGVHLVIYIAIDAIDNVIVQ